MGIGEVQPDGHDEKHTGSKKTKRNDKIRQRIKKRKRKSLVVGIWKQAS